MRVRREGTTYYGLQEMSFVLIKADWTIHQTLLS